MADVRIYELPSAASWNGFFPQDKPGGSTECVSVATVEAKLVEDGFVKTAVLVAGYQPLENQRLSTTDSPTFAGLLLSGATANKLARFDASKNLVSYDLVASDIPALDAAKITTGTWADARIASATIWNAKLGPSNVSGYADEVAAFGGANTVNGDQGLKRYRTGGITTLLGLGTGATEDAAFAAQCQIGGTSAFRHYQGPALRFQEILRADGTWALQSHNAYDALIDAPITVENGSGGTLALGGGGRPINLSSGSRLQINGTDAITSARAGNLTALTVGSTTGFVRSTAGVYSASALSAADIPATINSNTTGSAAKWTTPRTLTIGATGKTIDGTGNQSWSLAEIGALAVGGGTMTNDAQVAFNNTAAAWEQSAITITRPFVAGSQTQDAGIDISTGNGHGLRIALQSGNFYSGLQVNNASTEFAVELLLSGAGTKSLYAAGLVLLDGAVDAGAGINISGGALQVAGVDVVGTRKTGWVAATGTATRTTFATGSVTTAQLAERVKALLDDLISHGLIGT